jgi:hypothetical protein
MAFRVVVTGFIGTGTSRDPFRADVANPADVRLSIVDLSANPSAPDLCVAILDYGDGVATQPATRANGTSSGFGFWDLGEDPQIRLSGGRRTQLETRFGISIPNDTTLGEAVLLKLGAALRPERDRMLRIRCGRVVLHERVSISGGATDPFTYSDGDLHTVSGGVWIRHTDSPAIGGTIVVVSQTVDVGANEDGADRYDADLGTAAHYAQTVVTISGTPTGTDVMAGPITRMGTTTTDVSGFVGLAGSNNSAQRFMLSRVDSGTFTTLDSDTTSAGTYELRLESDGSSQTLFIDDVSTLSATDTAYPSNTYTGIYSYHYGAYSAIIDDFESGTSGHGTATPGAIAVSTAIPQATATTSNPFVTQVKVGAVTATRSPTFTLDTSPLENDIIYLWVSSTTTATVADVAGWVNVLGSGVDVESDAHEMTCVYHIVTAAEDTANTVTWTLTNMYGATETGDLAAVVVRQADPADPLAGVNSTFDSANTVTPAVLASVTPDASGGIILSGVVQDSTATYTQPANWTVRATSNSNQGLSVFQYNLGVTSGVGVGPTNVTPDAGDEYISITLVVKSIANPNATVTPGAIAVPITVPAAGAKAGSAPTPAAIPVPITVPQATPLAGSRPTPAAIAVPITVPQATPLAGSAATPAAIPVPVTLPQATGSADATVAPDAIPVPITVPQATPLAGSAPTPAAISVPITVPQATPQAGSVVTPAAIPVPITLPAATASASSGATVEPDVIDVAVTVPQATPLAGSVATPDAVPVPVSIPQATPLASSAATPAAIPVPITIPQATASSAESATVEPDVIDVTTSIPQATPLAGSVPTPGAIMVPVSIPQATAQASSTVTPGVISVLVALPQATPLAGSVALPTAINVAVSIPQATAQAGSTVAPDAIDVVITLPAASASGASAGTGAPNAIAVAVSIPQAIPLAGSTVTPAAIPVPITLPQATGSAASDATATPGPISVPITVPQATPLAGSAATPAAIQVTLTLPQATPLAGSTATPNVLTATVAIPQATPQAGSVVTPVAILVPLTLPTPTLEAGSTATPGPIAVLISIPQASPAGDIFVIIITDVDLELLNSSLSLRLIGPSIGMDILNSDLNLGVV